jgi:acyl-CoA thioesterase-1
MMSGLGRRLEGRWTCGASRLAAGAFFALLASASASAFAADGSCRVSVETLASRGRLAAIAASFQGKHGFKVLAIGSSSTEGIGASSKSANYPSRLQADLKALWRADATVVNAGVSGEVAQATVDRLEALLRSDKPDLVIWQVGTNDAMRGEGEEGFRAVLERGIAVAARSGVELVLLDQQYFPTVRDPARYERFVKIVSEVGALKGVSVFSRYTLMRGWAERSPAEVTAALASDGFHMSDRGYACLAGVLAEQLDRTGRTAGRVAEAGLRGASQRMPTEPR